MKSNLALFFIFFLGSLWVHADQPSKEPVTKVSVANKSGTSTMHSVYGYSFKYPKCWDVSGEMDDVTRSENVTIGFTKDCPKQTFASAMEVSIINSEASNDEWVNDTRTNPYHRVIYQKAIDISGVPAILYETLKDESDKLLIDDPGQGNFSWCVKLFCGKSNLEFSYFGHLDKKGRDETRKNHELPTVFKEFIDGFKCDPKKVK